MSKFAFTDQQKADVLAAAVSSLPAEASSDDVAKQVERIATYLSPASLVTSGFDSVERKLEKVVDWKTIFATLVHINKESSSTRAVLVFQSAPNQHNHNTGQEIARSAPTDWDPLGKALAKSAQQMLGHKVMVRIGVEQMDNGRKSRVIHDIRSLGADAMFFPNGEGQPPVLPQIHWNVLGGNGNAFDTSKLMGPLG